LPEPDQVVRETIGKVLSLVDQATRATMAGESASCNLLIWKSAAEAEYLALHVSVAHGLGDFEPAKKGGVNPEPSLEAARQLLQDAQMSLQSKPREAYGAIRQAVAILRKMYVAVEREPRSQSPRSPKNE
jgi:hypothetical protein